MGFFDFLSESVQSGMSKMNDMYLSKICDSYEKLKNDSTYELIDLLPNVEQSYLRIAIILAISEKDVHEGICQAQRFNLSKGLFAKFIDHPRLKILSRKIVQNWGS